MVFKEKKTLRKDFVYFPLVLELTTTTEEQERWLIEAVLQSLMSFQKELPPSEADGPQRDFPKGAHLHSSFPQANPLTFSSAFQSHHAEHLDGRLSTYNPDVATEEATPDNMDSTTGFLQGQPNNALLYWCLTTEFLGILVESMYHYRNVHQESLCCELLYAGVAD